MRIRAVALPQARSHFTVFHRVAFHVGIKQQQIPAANLFTR